MESNAGYSQRFNSYCSFESNLRQHEVDTTSKFIVQRKDKDFGVYHTITEPWPACYHVHWESKHIPFDGTPYIVVGRKGYDCHQGPDRHERHKSRQQELLNDHTDHLGLHKERRRLVQDTKKLGCPAAILVVHVTRFPEYKIDEDSPKLRRKKAGELKVALATNQPVVQEQQFNGSFPPVEEHRNHPVTGEAREIGDPRSTPPPVTRETGNPSSSPPPETRETGDPSSTEMTKQSKTKKRQKCGSLLREISDLAYPLQDESFLDSVIGRLTDLLEDVRVHTPHDETLPLSYTPPSKKARHLKSLSMVPKKHPFSGRVGRRAEAMRSSSSFKLTNLPPSTHLPSDHSQSTTTVQSLAVAEGVLSNMPASVSSPDYQSQTTEATTALSPLKSIKVSLFIKSVLFPCTVCYKFSKCYTLEQS
ncbi:uncharacterized protein LOC130112333 [Lampris incognitus]|uniref:uncharacterized protein LOC130112333 n=1 Tax=Lampris incognitus TaxID=2546036 RepID=UPI0024B4C3FF|nr:uncharacterized protein LOC130112333 [Lampris incognitus]